MFVSPSTRRQAVGLVAASAMFACLAFMASDLRAGNQGDKKDGKTDLDAFQGNWIVAKLKMMGAEVPDEIVKDIKVSIAKDKISLTAMGTDIKVSIKLDESKKPKQIDFKHDDGDMSGYGIYEVTGDTIKIYAAEKAEDRPKDFDGKDVTIIVLKRAKAEKNRPRPVSFRAASEDDAEKLQGTWSMTAGTKDGTPAPPEFVGKFKLTFKAGGKIDIDTPDKVMAGTYKLDEKSKPARIEITSEDDKKLHGIYELKDGTLKVCLTEANQARPTEFKGEAGSKAIFLVFKREKDKGKEDPSPVDPLACGLQDKNDRDAIQGTYKVTAFKMGDMKIPPEAKQLLDNIRIDLKDGKIRFTIVDMVKEGTYTIDYTKNPKHMNLMLDDNNIKAIYELKGGKLRIAGSEKGKDRPLDFAGKEGLILELDQTEDAPQPVVFLPAAQDKTTGKDKKSDKEMIQGTWSVESALEDGTALGAEILSSIKFIVKDDNIEIKIGDAGIIGKFTIDDSKKPKQVDVKLDMGSLTGIYEFKDNTVIMCFAEDGKKRPTEFKSAEGSGLKLITLKRAADKKADKESPAADDGELHFVVFVDEQEKSTQPPPKKQEEKPAPKLTDAQKLLGTWRFVKARSDGADVPSDVSGSVRLTFDADGKVQVKGTVKGDENGTYHLDMRQGFLDLTSDAIKDQIQGIYKFDGDKLMVCFGGGKGTQRPKDFSAELNSKTVLFVLERVTPLEVAGEAGMRNSQNNMKQILLAFHNFHSAFNNFPLHAIYSKDGKTPLLSWRVAILPYIEQQNLYMQFKLDEPWDSDNNKKLIPMMPKTYMPSGTAKAERGKTYYVLLTGKETPFDGPKKITFVNFTDGTSNTGVLFEAKNPVTWTKPDDLVLPKKGDKMPELGGMFKSGMNLGFADGSVRWVRRDIDAETLRAIITHMGGEVIDFSKTDVTPTNEPAMAAPAKADTPREIDENNLKQIGLAFHNYHDTYKGLIQAITSKDGKPLLSWRVALLPFIEEVELYNQFKLDEPWDSPNNKKLIDKMPRIYAPIANVPKEPGRTFYQVFTGPESLFPDPAKKRRLIDITDGTSNTALVFEGANSVIWTQPDDLVLPKAGQKLPGVGGMFKEGMNVLFCDGAVRWLRRDIDAASLRAIITPAGGEIVDVEKLMAEKK